MLIQIAKSYWDTVLRRSVRKDEELNVSDARGARLIESGAAIRVEDKGAAQITALEAELADRESQITALEAEIKKLKK